MSLSFIVMKKKSLEAIFICLSLFFFSETQAQFQIAISSGYATYKMEDLKAHQEELRPQFPVDAKTTVSFPGYLFYELNGGYTFNSKLFTGVGIAYGSTGGKIHYGDYSGEISLEHRLKHFTLSTIVGRKILLKDRLNLILDLQPSFIFGGLEMAFESRIGTDVEDDLTSFKSLNIAIQPNIQLERRAGPVFLFIRAGYSQNIFSSKLFLKADDQYYLLDEDGEKIRADWSGLRATLGLSYVLKSK